MLRDRDIRNDILARVDALNEFGLVTTQPLNDPQGQENVIRTLVITPSSTAFNDAWTDNGGPVRIATSVVNLEIIVRNEDSVLRDEDAERLVNKTLNAIEGQSLSSITYPDRTRAQSLAWKKPFNIERSVMIDFTYVYDYGNFGNLGTDE